MTLEDTQGCQEYPLVSVVVPSFNRAQYLRQTLDSILGQDYPNIECIVVDAGSTDESLDVVRSYGERITLVTRPDRGAFDAINDGWQMSRGEVLAWLNNDDTWVTPDAVSTVVTYMREHPEADVVYGDCGGIDADGRLIWYGPAAQWDLRRAVMTCDAIINQPASFIRRSTAEKAGWLFPAWCHDHELWIRVSLAGGRFAALPQHLANARIWANNLHMQPSLVVPAKIALTRRALDDLRLPADLRRRRGQVLSNAYLRCLDFMPKPSHWRYALYALVRAFLASPANTPNIVTQTVVHLAWLAPPLRERLRKRYGHGVVIKRGEAAPARRWVESA